MKLNRKFIFLGLLVLFLIVVKMMNVTIEGMEEGINKEDIPLGQENLYVLKSKVVPPVCPKCPDMKECPRQKPCPPCPPCGRCPEPNFTCKKVPNYSNVPNKEQPQPVLNSFSQFGM